MRLRFTIRDLLWLALAAVVAAWWIDHYQNANLYHYEEIQRGLAQCYK